MSINELPTTIASGLLDGTAGTPAIALTGAYKCTSPVSSAKGVYTCVLVDKPKITTKQANYLLKMGSNKQSVTAAITAYDEATGILQFTCLTSDTKAASEGSVWFEFVQVDIS